MKSPHLKHSVEYTMNMADGSPGVILQVRILDADDRHAYSQYDCEAQGTTLDAYISAALRKLAPSLAAPEPRASRR